MSNTGPISAGRLKSFVERVEKLIEERSAIQGDIRDVFAEAKGIGYDAKAMRWVVQERALDAGDRAERDTLRDTYAHALGLAVEAVQGGMSYREAEEEFGFSKSAIHRASHQARDAVSGTVEMTEGDLGAAEPVRQMIADDLGDPLLVIDGYRAAFREKGRTLAAGIKPVAVVQTDIVNPHAEIDLTIPDFLRQVRV